MAELGSTLGRCFAPMPSSMAITRYNMVQVTNHSVHVCVMLCPAWGRAAVMVAKWGWASAPMSSSMALTRCNTILYKSQLCACVGDAVPYLRQGSCDGGEVGLGFCPKGF